MAPPPPNLFSFATKELSQDAIIVWLLHWAWHTQPTPEQAPLVAAGQTFLQSLLNLFPRAGLKISHIQNFDIIQQKQHIDVWAKITTNNATYALLIEDKTTSHQHTNQLQRYINTLSSTTGQHNIPQENILPVYLKTHNSTEITLAKEIAAEKDKSIKYQIYNRQHFLTALKPYQQLNNDIFQDFYTYLKNLDTAYNSYKTMTSQHLTALGKTNNPTHAPWVGFLTDLQTELNQPEPCWGYIHNQSGGFMLFHGKLPQPQNPDTILKNVCFYYQINCARQVLQVRIDTQEKPKKERQQIRNAATKWLTQQAGLPKPHRQSIGKTMAVAEIPLFTPTERICPQKAAKKINALNAAFST